MFLRLLSFFWTKGDVTLNGSGILAFLIIPAGMLLQLHFGG